MADGRKSPDAISIRLRHMLEEPIKVWGERELIYPTELEKFMRRFAQAFQIANASSGHLGEKCLRLTQHHPLTRQSKLDKRA